MKAKINFDNKKAFFAHYYNQSIVTDGSQRFGYSVSDFFEGIFDESKAYLELTSLSQISEEDMISIGFDIQAPFEDVNIKFYFERFDTHWHLYYNGISADGYLLLEDYDFLRSKGYALPYMGITIEEMVDAKWIKLKNEL